MPHEGEKQLSELLAGVGRCDITPAPGTPQGGWGAQAHQRGSGTEMPMYATAIALREGDVRCVIVEADAIGFDQEWTDRIVSAIAALTGLPPSQLRFSCSHTHSGANTFRLANISEGRDMIDSYLASLPHRIAAAAWQALQQMEPVHVGSGCGSCAISRIRRVHAQGGEVVVGVNEEAVADSTVGVIRFDRYDGSTLATVVHYACHPTTVGWQSDQFTPDYPGPMRFVVEKQLGGTCLFLQGAAGDLGPRRGFCGDLSVYRRLGQELGLAAASIALAVDTMQHKAELVSVMPSGANIAQYTYRPSSDNTPLGMMSRRLQLPIRTLQSEHEIAKELEDLRERVEELRAASNLSEMLLVQAKATQMGWRLENSRRYGGQATTEWPMQVIRIGSTALVSIAGEPFSSIAKRIRAESAATVTFVSGYSNGGFGYIPDRAAYAEGGYEVEATPFSEDAADIVVGEALAAIRELFQEVHL